MIKKSGSKEERRRKTSTGYLSYVYSILGSITQECRLSFLEFLSSIIVGVLRGGFHYRVTILAQFSERLKLGKIQEHWRKQINFKCE